MVVALKVAQFQSSALSNPVYGGRGLKSFPRAGTERLVVEPKALHGQANFI